MQRWNETFKLKLQCKTLDREFQARRTFYAKFQKNCGNDEVRITSIIFTPATIKSCQAQTNLSTDCPGVSSATFHCSGPSWQNIQTSSSHPPGIIKQSKWGGETIEPLVLNSIQGAYQLELGTTETKELVLQVQCTMLRGVRGTLNNFL